MAITTNRSLPTVVFEERRKRRSRDRGKALRYLLEHSRERGGFEAMAVADGEGLAVGRAGDAGLCRELAAVAPLLGRALFGLPLPQRLKGAEVVLRSVPVHQQDLYLVAIGGHAARDAVLDHTATGVRRILQTN
ncbi:MAG TPA: hypothetical protein RMF84_13920 [Polyangiaceae bacterium LLY-WYZ-14_1]|nr:hypothetical protein [Polyangiaceae bacterium LLY-WYZ-14_1]